MLVTVWGCRGSIASPGYDTLRYGGESSCFEVRTDDGGLIVIDAGSGIRKLGAKLLREPGPREMVLLLTHSHWDHPAGFPFFRPAFVPGTTISLCGGADAQDSILKSLQHEMEPPYFPVDMSAMKAAFVKGCRCGRAECDHRLPGAQGDHACDSIPLSHPNGGYGYRITGKSGRAFVLLTDNELEYRHETGRSRDDYVEFCRGADLLFHDAQYTDDEYEKTRTWGHSTFKDAVDFAIEAGVRRLGLLHHDPDRTDDEIDAIVRWCKDCIREKNSALECFACAEGMTLEV